MACNNNNRTQNSFSTFFDMIFQFHVTFDIVIDGGDTHAKQIHPPPKKKRDVSLSTLRARSTKPLGAVMSHVWLLKTWYSCVQSLGQLSLQMIVIIPLKKHLNRIWDVVGGGHKEQHELCVKMTPGWTNRNNNTPYYSFSDPSVATYLWNAWSKPS